MSNHRANELFNRALNLVSKVTKTETDIRKLQEGKQNEDLAGLEKQLQELIQRMNHYTQKIEGRVQHYKICN